LIAVLTLPGAKAGRYAARQAPLEAAAPLRGFLATLSTGLGLPFSIATLALWATIFSFSPCAT
jgi:hypothetical protein